MSLKVSLTLIVLTKFLPDQLLALDTQAQAVVSEKELNEINASGLKVNRNTEPKVKKNPIS